MTTFVQSVSNTGGVVALNPLRVWDSLSPSAQVALLSLPNPSSITTLGASGASASLTYDAISLLQTIQPAVLASGLSAAQHQELATALGLSANATSAELLDAINTLLVPADSSQALVNILVGDVNSAATGADSIIPNFLDDQGEIIGVPGDSTSQIQDEVLATILDLGASGVVTSPASSSTDNTQGVAENPTAVEANPVFGDNSGNEQTPANSAATGTVTGSSIPLPENTEGAATAGAIQTLSELTANPDILAEENPLTTENLPTTELNPIVTAATDANAGTILETLPADDTTQTPTATVLANITTEEAAVAATTTTTATVIPTDTTATDEATATVAANTALEATRGLLAANTGNLPTTGVNATATGAQTTPTPAVVGNAAVNNILSPLADETVTIANIPPTASATFSVTAQANAAPGGLDNANTVLQNLLTAAAAHALGQNNPASAYSVAGAVYQMGVGVDHTRQADLTGKLPDIRSTVGPVSRVAAVRGTMEKQS